MTVNMRHRWTALYHQLAAGASSSSWDLLYDELVERYGESHRAYHTLEHVADGIALLDDVRAHADAPAALEAALWYHDVVYDTLPHAAETPPDAASGAAPGAASDAASNEALSAALAAERLLAVGVSTTSVQAVSELILATAHLAPEAHTGAACTAADVDLLLDIDLSILGRPPEVFARYDRAVRQEYAWLDSTLYRAGRAAVLRGFLARPVIFRSAHMRARFEAQARANLSDALEVLELAPMLAPHRGD